MSFRVNWRLVLLTVVALSTIYFLLLVRQVLTPFLLGGILAYLMFRPTSWLERHGLSRSWSILVVYALLGIIIYAILFWIVPQFWEELKGLAEYVPRYWHNLESLFKSKNQGISQAFFDLTPIKDHLQKTAVDWMTARATGIIDSLDTLVSIIFSPLLAYYVLRDWERLREGFLALWPVRYRQTLRDLGTDIDQILFGFVKGHLSVCLIEGVITGLVMSLLGVKFAFLLGVFAGITELFPYFGPFLAGIPAVGIALMESPRLAVYTLIAFVIIQEIEANVISPRIIGNQVGLNPLLVIFSLLAGGSLYGIWGILLAVPVTAVLKVLFQFLYYRLV